VGILETKSDAGVGRKVIVTCGPAASVTEGGRGARARARPMARLGPKREAREKAKMGHAVKRGRGRK
jgi:hypothetical protein